MSRACCDRFGEPAPEQEAAPLAATDWLALAASPTFAVMAVLSAAMDGGPAAMICSGSALMLNGMVAMYLLMAAFHLGPWLALVSGRRRAA